MDWTHIISVAGQLATDTTNKYGPAAWDTVLWLVFIDRLQFILIGLFCLLCATGSIFTGVKLVKKGRREYEEGPTALGILLCIFGGGGFSIGAAANLFNIWNWVGLFKPELVLAKMAIDKVL